MKGYKMHGYDTKGYTWKVKARIGMERKGLGIGLGMARKGKESHGKEMKGNASQGKPRKFNARKGNARHGMT